MISTLPIQVVSGGNLTNGLVLTVKPTLTSSLLCAVTASGKTAPVTGITDTGSNAWSKLQTNDNAVQGSFWATTVARPNSITAITISTGGSNELINAIFFEIQGANNLAPVDVFQGANNPTGTAASTGASARPGWSRDFVIGMITGLGGATSNPDTGATFTPGGVGARIFIDNAGVPSAHWKTGASYFYAPDQDAQTFSTTLAESGTWVAIEVMLKSNQLNNQNYQFVSAGNGMSVTEKIR